jgi:hypothetical protein
MEHAALLCKISFGTQSHLCALIPSDLPSEIVAAVNVVVYIVGTLAILYGLLRLVGYIVGLVGAFLHQSMSMAGWGLAAGVGISVALSIIFAALKWMPVPTETDDPVKNWVAFIYPSDE